MPVTLITKIADRTHHGEAVLKNSLWRVEDRSSPFAVPTSGQINYIWYKSAAGEPVLGFSFNGPDPNTGGSGINLSLSFKLDPVEAQTFGGFSYGGATEPPDSDNCLASLTHNVPGFTVSWPSGVTVAGSTGSWNVAPGSHTAEVDLTTEIWSTSGGDCEFVTAITVAFAGKTITWTQSASYATDRRSILSGLQVSRQMAETTFYDSVQTVIKASGGVQPYGQRFRNTETGYVYQNAPNRGTFTNLPATNIAGISGIVWEVDGVAASLPWASTSGQNSSVSIQEPLTLSNVGGVVTVNYTAVTPSTVLYFNSDGSVSLDKGLDRNHRLLYQSADTQANNPANVFHDASAYGDDVFSIAQSGASAPYTFRGYAILYGRATTPASAAFNGYSQQNRNDTTTGGNVTFSYTPLTPAIVSVSLDRGLGRALHLAMISGTNANHTRYTDAVPEAVAATVTVHSAAVALSMRFRRGARINPEETVRRRVGRRRSPAGVIDFYVVTSAGAVLLYVSKDQGRTFALATTLAAAGYSNVAHDVDPGGGLAAAAIYNTSGTKWQLVVLTLGSDGSTWTVSSVRDLVTTTKAGGALRRREDGVWEFAYVTSAGGSSILRCTALKADGTGTWS